MPKLSAGCTQYDYQSQPGCSPSENRTPENDYSLAYCGNYGAICNADDLAEVAVFDFKACAACRAQCAAILAAEVPDIRRFAVPIWHRNWLWLWGSTGKWVARLWKWCRRSRCCSQ